jgi:pseudouridine-5'-phosphate glycosidase
VPVLGFQSDDFPAFYQRKVGGGASVRVDARFDDITELANFATKELLRTGRGIVVCNPIPHEHEIPSERFEVWKQEALRLADKAGATGRDATPFVLSRLHSISSEVTLQANIELVRSNARLAGRLAAAMEP